MFNLRDKDKSCFRIFITLIQSVKDDRKLSSDEIAAMTKLTRGTVIHHLNHLMDSGMVVSEKNKYVLRMDSLEEVVEHMKKDADDAWERLREVARDIDEKLGL